MFAACQEFTIFANQVRSGEKVFANMALEHRRNAAIVSPSFRGTLSDERLAERSQSYKRTLGHVQQRERIKVPR